MHNGLHRPRRCAFRWAQMHHSITVQSTGSSNLCLINIAVSQVVNIAYPPRKNIYKRFYS